MYLIKNVGKALFGANNKHEIIQIDSGELFLIRPRSPRGYSECIFKDSAASIRRSSSEFNYHLVIQRVFEEGEEQFIDESEGDGEDDDKDEKIFLLDEGLRFQSTTRDGKTIFSWLDLLGDPGDLYEFVCDTSTQSSLIQTFELAVLNCLYERKYRKSHSNATSAQLEQFVISAEIRDSVTLTDTFDLVDTKNEKNDAIDEITTTKKSVPTKSMNTTTVDKETSSHHRINVIQAPPGGEILAKESAELHLFDVRSGHFVLQDSKVFAYVLDYGNYHYWLKVESGDNLWIAQIVIPDISPVFNFDYLSFIFNVYENDNTAFSWLLRFADMKKLESFQEGVMRALWEHLNEAKWLKTKPDERDYIIEAFQDITMEDTEAENDEADHEELSLEDEEEDNEKSSKSHTGFGEEDDDDGRENSQLAVGTTNDRSYVVRGSKIGVFRHISGGGLEFATTINKVQTPNGKIFEPKKVMLHVEDSSMVLQNQTNPNSLYRLDLETGKVVDEWKVHDDIPVINFLPDNKFSQMTAEQTFIGHSRNALFRIDPRIAGDKLVDSELKQYVTKNDFSAAATTQKGYIAVASNKGDIRLFDRLGINAKTHLPALGEPITGVDVSADGHWILATCRTYLLLIDATLSEGKYAGKLGFEKSFGKDSKPKPRRLALNPSHVAQFQQETKSSISFTTAKFNTGPDSSETSIITSTGPFIITWNMSKITKGSRDPYTIKRYAEDVKADNFEFGSDKNVIVALPDFVDMVAKKSFKKPTRESISTPVKQLRSRSSIVNSPY